ncbi:triphosphoribosyl-dephospho-CoA synthase [Siphonobacter aquaeclarae]|jgi:hypothetical protein|uniref:Small multi-drug export protein n=1 Tax=Siphonobacter aquaeclarae TaxID=563176 RepID=A0A1G9RAY4_9BACT|nr:hypothetical protein [Siphonobacter aquaeclarae]MBO9637978.1 hypothetical protein [Siphonobacter aquaeclarae]SDM20393.1 hypothetical protein SAMN04488090_2819 [Siphonobacter aquaeclarae]
MEITEKYLGVILPSMLKFLLGPLAGVALKLTWWETMLCTIAGMMLTVLVFIYLGKAIRMGWQRYRKSPPKRFSKNSRRAVRVYRRFGMPGIACLTPLIFTPIGGTLLATSFNVAPVRIIFWMGVFAFFWGLILTLAIYHIPGLQTIL